MPLYCVQNTLWVPTPTTFEFVYYLPDLPTSGQTSGLMMAFFPGVGTDGYRYSVSMPELRQPEILLAAPFTFNEWMNGVTISDRGVWSDPIAADVTVSQYVRIRAVFEGWVPLFSYGLYPYEIYTLEYGSGDTLSPFPIALIEVEDLSSCYPGNLPDRPIIAPFASRYTSEVFSAIFDETPELNLDPVDPQINWSWWAETLDTGCISGGYIWGPSYCLRYQDGIEYTSDDDINPLYLGYVGTDFGYVFEAEAKYWALECTFEYDLSATPGQLAELFIANGYGRPEDSGFGYVKLDFNSASTNKYVKGYVGTWDTGNIIVGTHGDSPNKYSLRMEYNGDYTFNFFWKEGDIGGKWNALPGNPYLRTNYMAHSHTGTPGLGFLMINYAGAIKLLYAKVEYTETPVYSYSGGYSQYDLSSMECGAAGFNFYQANQGYMITPSLIIGAYQTNNERADLILPMFTISSEAHWMECSITFPMMTCGAWEDADHGWAECTFPMFTITANDVDVGDDRNVHFTALPFFRVCEAYGFIQGEPDDIADDYKPRFILTDNEEIEDLAEEIFWGLG